MSTFAGSASLVGCYSTSPPNTPFYDQNGGYTSDSLTLEGCYNYCATIGLGDQYIGLLSPGLPSYGDSCVCSPDFTPGGIGTCDTYCSGAQTTEWCGGLNSVSVYQILPVVVESPLDVWTSYGCYTETTLPGLDNHVLTAAQYESNLMTPKLCAETCTESYQFFGVENGDMCYCGNEINTSGDGGVASALDYCNAPCGGDTGATCGSTDYVNLYWNPVWYPLPPLPPPPPPPPPPPTTSTTSTTATVSTTTYMISGTTSAAATHITATSMAPTFTPSVSIPSESTSTFFSTDLVTIFACAETVIECPYRSQTQTIITSVTPVFQVIHTPTVIISGGNAETIWIPVSTFTLETNVEETGIAILIPGEEAVAATAAISSSTMSMNGSIPASFVPVTAAAAGVGGRWMGVMVGGITGFGVLFFLL